MFATLLLWPIAYLRAYFETQEPDDDFWDSNAWIWAFIFLVIGVIIGGFVIPLLPIWHLTNVWLRALLILVAYVIFGLIMWFVMAYKPRDIHALVTGNYLRFPYVGQFLIGVGFFLYALVVRLFI